LRGESGQGRKPSSEPSSGVRAAKGLLFLDLGKSLVFGEFCIVRDVAYSLAISSSRSWRRVRWLHGTMIFSIVRMVFIMSRNAWSICLLSTLSNPQLEEFALDSSHDHIPLLLANELVHIICPALTLHLQVVHAVAHHVQLLRSFVQLPCQVITPALLRSVSC
jgi:hypothetical protein